MHSDEALDETRVYTCTDRVYGAVTLSAASRVVIEHEWFARLLHIRQMGASVYVFPHAQQTRAEHCIGVAFLARCMVRALAIAQPELCLSERHMLRVEISALSHDLGHACTSHSFDAALSGDGTLPTHEARSCALVRALFATRAHVFTAHDADWVCWLIDPENRPAPHDATAYLYLASLVSSPSLDCDRATYVLSDAWHVGAALTVNTDWYRAALRAAMERVRVRDQRLCYAYQDAAVLHEVNRARTALHRAYYNCPRAVAVEHALHQVLQRLDARLHWGDMARELLRAEQAHDAHALHAAAARFATLTDTLLERVAAHCPLYRSLSSGGPYRCVAVLAPRGHAYARQHRLPCRASAGDLVHVALHPAAQPHTAERLNAGIAWYGRGVVWYNDRPPADAPVYLLLRSRAARL